MSEDEFTPEEVEHILESLEQVDRGDRLYTFEEVFGEPLGDVDG
jgi:uncharacterized membrane protein